MSEITQANKEQKVRKVRLGRVKSRKGGSRGKGSVRWLKKFDVCVCVRVQLVEAVYVFLSEPRINAWTAKREETGLSVGWDRIKGTSVESGGQG